MDNRDYWNSKIIEWENSMRGESGISLTERIASYFRKPLEFRSAISISILERFVEGKTVLELGCGSGFFAFELYERGKPGQITGIDVSNNAVARARELSRSKGLADEVMFLEGDITAIALPEADVTIGMGLLDYLTLREIESLFDGMKGEYFLFTFSEKKFSLLRLLHMIYLRLQKCPRHFYYTKDEIASCLGNERDGLQFLTDRKLSFGCIVHNLPWRIESQG